MTVSVSTLTQADTVEWDDYVRHHPHGSFFHRAAWANLLADSFGHRPHFLLLRRAGAIAGLLPLAEQTSLLFGKSLISLPFCVYGGPLADDADAEAALTEAAESLMRKLGHSVMEWRTTQAFAGEVPAGWAERGDLYATFRRALVADDDANLKAIPRKQRAVVRKAIEQQLETRVDQNVGLFYRLYAESVRNLGTPVFSRRYFERLRATFPDEMNVVTVFENGQARSGVLNFYWKGEVLPYYGGGTPAARGCGANDMMYWETMRHASRHGCTSFDFGRSKFGTGAFAFKKNWGFAPTALPYRYRLAEGASIPDHNPLNPKYRLFIAAWQKLPLAVANAVGPVLIKGLG